MLTADIEITCATALEFRSPIGRASSGRASNVIIQLDARVGGRSVRGFGEAFQLKRTAGHVSDAWWRCLETATSHIIGLRLPGHGASGNGGDIAVRVSEATRELERLIQKAGHHRRLPRTYLGVLAGLECALLDIAARATNHSFAALLGGQRRPIAAVRLTETDVRDAATTAAQAASASASGRMPIWLKLNAPTNSLDMSALVESLADQIRGRELPPHMFLQHPYESSDPGVSARLQAAARELLPPREAGPGMVVVVDTPSLDDAVAAVGEGATAISLDPWRLGGTLPLLDVASKVGAVNSSIFIGVATSASTTGIARRILLELASAVPQVRYIALHDDNGLVRTEPTELLDHAGNAHNGDLPGFGCEVDLAPSVQYLRRYLRIPTTQASQALPTSNEENQYDLDPLLVFESRSGKINLGSPLLDRSALAYGLNTTRLSRSVLLAEHVQMNEPIAFDVRRSTWTGVPTRRLVDRKDITKKILQAAGVATPRGKLFQPEQTHEAVEYALSLDAPVVIKPRAGSHGRGVTTNLRGEADIRRGIATLGVDGYADRPFVVEEYVPGVDYRFLVVGDKVVSVVERFPASVAGDGHSTVTELVLQKNSRRLLNPQSRGSLIGFNANAMHWLSRQMLSPHSVPTSGQYVQLGSAGNIANGGDSREVLDETHESLLNLAVRATKAIPGLDYSGVDLIGSHRHSTTERPAVVIEVNTNPGIDLNHFPMFGTPRDVASEIVVRQCELAGYRPDPFRDRLSVRILVEGVVQGVGYRKWFQRLAASRGVVGSIRNRSSGGVEAHVAGMTDDVWVMSSRALIGPRRASVSRVVTTHVSDADVEPKDRLEVVE